MARRSSTQPPQPEPEMLMSAEQAAKKLDERTTKGRELHVRQVGSVDELSRLDDDYDKWNVYNRDLLARVIFTTDKIAKEYSSSAFPAVITMGFGAPSHAQKLKNIRDYISAKMSSLESIKERLELFPVAHGVSVAPPPTRASQQHSNRVFVVHGHDNEVKQTVARFLERFGITAVILHEQATQGRTLVEKLEHYSDVDFAVVLLTPDDIGASKEAPGKMEDRARQNVVLELGFFLGKLGRDHVCPLYRGPLELPSDYEGVGYVEMDGRGAWRMELATELQAAGFEIDMNKLLRDDLARR